MTETKDIFSRLVFYRVAEVEETPPPGRSPEAPRGPRYDPDKENDDENEDHFEPESEDTDDDNCTFEFPQKEDPMM